MCQLLLAYNNRVREIVDPAHFIHIIRDGQRKTKGGPTAKRRISKYGERFIETTILKNKKSSRSAESIPMFQQRKSLF